MSHKIPQVTEALWTAYEEYRIAKEVAKATDEKVTPQLNALAKEFSFANNFDEKRNGENEKIITTVDDMYMASDEDSAKFYAASSKLYKELGYDVEDGYCPVLISRSREIDASHKFIDESLYLTNSTAITKEMLMGNMKGRRKYLELTMKLMDSMKRSKEIDKKFEAELKTFLKLAS